MLKFFKVEYKNVGKPKRTTILVKETQEEAIGVVYDPEEVGKQPEIKDVTTPIKIPKGWKVQFLNDIDFPVVGTVVEDTPIKELKTLRVRLGNQKHVNLSLEKIESISPPSKDKNVMRMNALHF